MKTKRQTIFSLIVLCLMLALIVIMVATMVPLLKQILQNTADESKMIDYIHAYGAKGVPVLMALQALQVMMTVIPAAIIQILAGLSYGIWIGALICIAGTILGNLIVFTVLRQLKSAFSSFFKERGERGEMDEQAGKPKKNRLLSIAKLNQMKHPEYVAFLLFLIPGLPNGILPYIFAQTKITTVRYLISVSAACVPATLLCTWLGERISKGDYRTAIILAVVFIIIIGIVLIFRKRIMAKITSAKAE
ncbi:MAG: VTT domain-containing protein [Clostridiales Family XIII bacterium]|jgi:uncharacterized membrane protein YdjX (TVP38/TMEM64 family)|nr:VTT domain-containing protein [Clostridiales Family XIII bacterium]